MLKLINEELMAFSTINTVENGKTFTKIRVTTSNKLQQYENDSRNNRNTNNDNEEKPNYGPKSKVSIVSNVDALKPINREIIRISTSLKNIAEFEAQSVDSKTVDFDLPMTINVKSVNERQQNVEVRCHERGDDRANLYVIAFPFNGMIKPIPENPQYRIYKGLIASSAKPFFFNNRKYRKVLYLIIEINKNLFNPKHKYHTDKINIQLESYALYEDRETHEKKTNCEVFNLGILSGDGDYEINWNYNTVNDSIVMTAAPGQPLWVTYDMNARKSNNNHSRDNTTASKKSFNTKQKPITIEGDVMVTVNRHGIRKEIPIKNQKNQRSSRNYHNNDGSRDLDKMMMDSGMFEDDYNNRGKKNGGKRNNRNGRNKGRY